MLAPDAQMVLGIAATAIPFARTPEDQAERWLRVLRLHGEVGATLQALGVSEDSMRVHAESAEPGSHAVETDLAGSDVIALVTEQAARIALARGAPGLSTTDVLMAVLHVYGAVFERALRAHGTDAEEVLARLAADAPQPSASAESG
jgi:hypothetical protein